MKAAFVTGALQLSPTKDGSLIAYLDTHREDIMGMNGFNNQLSACWALDKSPEYLSEFVETSCTNSEGGTVFKSCGGDEIMALAFASFSGSRLNPANGICQSG
jgi:hypothetical protein